MLYAFYNVHAYAELLKVNVKVNMQLVIPVNLHIGRSGIAGLSAPQRAFEQAQADYDVLSDNYQSLRAFQNFLASPPFME